MDQSEPMDCDGTSTASAAPKDGISKSKWVSGMTRSQLEARQAVVEAELIRVRKLPANSAYAINRVRLLNKLLCLFSVSQRSASEDDELELLFATLSLR